MSKPVKFPFKVAPKPKFTIVGDEEIGSVEIATYGALLSREEAAIESAELWDADVINREISKFSKSVYDESFKDSSYSLPDVDLMVRRLLNGDYTVLSVRERELIGDYEFEIQEFTAVEGGTLSSLSESIYDREKTRLKDLTTPKADYDSAIRKIVQKYTVTIDKDAEALFDYTNQLLEFGALIGKERDRRFYAYALILAKSRLEGLEDITLGDLKDLIGRKLLERLSVFAFREQQGAAYDEAIEYPKEPPAELRSEAEIVKQ